MIKIRLFCAAGFSTGMLVKKMEAAALSRGIEVDVLACPQGKIDDNTNDIDVALLGPQVSYTLARSQEICAKKNVPIGVIPMGEYGTMNGEAVLNLALKLIEEHKK